MLGLFIVVLLAGLQQSTPPAASPATLTGTVYDRGAGLLPGVAVTLEGTAAPASQKVVTNGDGNWRIDNVQPGVYTLRFPLAGFTAEGQNLTAPVAIQRVWRLGK